MLEYEMRICLDTMMQHLQDIKNKDLHFLFFVFDLGESEIIDR